MILTIINADQCFIYYLVEYFPCSFLITLKNCLKHQGKEKEKPWGGDGATTDFKATLCMSLPLFDVCFYQAISFGITWKVTLMLYGHVKDRQTHVSFPSAMQDMQ